MLLMILAMCVIGMFMDTTSAAIIMVPIFYPIAAAAGIDGIHFGMVMVLTFILGVITPPVGVSLYSQPLLQRSSSPICSRKCGHSSHCSSQCCSQLLTARLSA